jgi:Cu/Ag efflux pump CusA
VQIFSISGIDVMVPMANASLGRMVFAILTTFVVPLLYAMLAERRIVGTKGAPSIAETENKR